MPASAEVTEYHGLPAVRWRSRDGASAVATLQGAHVVSWTPAGGDECLYVSERSAFEAGKAIRGGIPVVLPQFAERGKLPKHGFARNLPWAFVGVREHREGSQAVFTLASSAQTRALWPGEFRLELAATIGGPRLDVELRVANTGDAGFNFQVALHTYLRVADASTLRLIGLRGARYEDFPSAARGVEEREIVTAAEPIDRIYFASPRSTRLDDARRTLDIAQRGFTDTVVWNPGPELTARMPDMPPDGYRHMLCVEAAAIEPKLSLEPHDTWIGGQSIASRAV
jgi:glucose-6-phosphate 1-epimerase